MSDVAVVMHDGRVVERGPTERLFNAPQHSYTRTLLDAIPGRSHSPDVSMGSAGLGT
jgi:peptide/nickel transport system ATP-binding protein